MASENMCLADLTLSCLKKILEIARLINTHGNVVVELPHGYGTKLWLLSRFAAKFVDGR